MNVPVALSIADEDAQMGQCDCGGRWTLRSEHVVPLRGQWFDAIVARCAACDQRRPFLFDVTGFYIPSPRIWSTYGEPSRG